MARKRKRTCVVCQEKVALDEFTAHLKEAHQLTRKQYNALVQCKVCEKWVELGDHLKEAHSMTLDEYERYDPSPIFPDPPVVTFYRVQQTPPPPPPEPTIEVRLVKCEGNPFMCTVETRPGSVYHFTKPTKDEAQWVPMPAPDAIILLGGESVLPKYPQFKFERR